MRFIAVSLVLLLSACATQPITIQQAAAVPSSRILAPQWLSQGAYTGSLVIKRDSGFMGSACTIRVFVACGASCRYCTVREGRTFRGAR